MVVTLFLTVILDLFLPLGNDVTASSYSEVQRGCLYVSLTALGFFFLEASRTLPVGMSCTAMGICTDDENKPHSTLTPRPRDP